MCRVYIVKIKIVKEKTREKRRAARVGRENFLI